MILEIIKKFSTKKDINDILFLKFDSYSQTKDFTKSKEYKEYLLIKKDLDSFLDTVLKSKLQPEINSMYADCAYIEIFDELIIKISYKKDEKLLKLDDNISFDDFIGVLLNKNEYISSFLYPANVQKMLNLDEQENKYIDIHIEEVICPQIKEHFEKSILEPLVKKNKIKKEIEETQKHIKNIKDLQLKSNYIQNKITQLKSKRKLTKEDTELQDVLNKSLEDEIKIKEIKKLLNSLNYNESIF